MSLNIPNPLFLYKGGGKMWYYKLVVSAGEIYYYDYNELNDAKMIRRFTAV